MSLEKLMSDLTNFKYDISSPDKIDSQIEINAEIWPVSLAHKGSLGVVTISLDLVPLLTKTECLLTESIDK